MSVYPEFLQHIQEQGLYVDGYNYEEMYNIMVNNITHNFIPSFSFIYSYDEINELYDYLDNLLHSNDINEVNDIDEVNDVNEVNDADEIHETNQINQTNQMNDSESETDIETESDDIYSDNDNDINATAQQMLNNYLASIIHPIQTNIIYYNNTSNINTNYSNNSINSISSNNSNYLSNLYNITYLNNSIN